MNTKNKKIVIAGAGASGLTSAIYLARAGYEVHVFTDEEESISCLVEAPLILNYPGFPEGISGYDLLELFTKQAKDNGVIFHSVGIKYVICREMKAVDKYNASHTFDEFIMATGVKPRQYTCNGIEAIPVHTCAVCDGSLYGKKDNVAIVGGGDTAINSAMYLSDIVGEVHVIVRKNHLRATNMEVYDRLVKKENVHVLYEKTIGSIRQSDNGQKCFCLMDNDGNAIADGIRALFSCIGYDVNEINIIGENSRVLKCGDCFINDKSHVWKCGDCVEQYHQVSVAVGSGATVALKIIGNN